MNIICHRGLWKKKIEQNQFKACISGLEKFDGIEIDLKNHNGEIVLSHDPLKSKTKYLKLEDCFRNSPQEFFALNIKEDGLSGELSKLIKKYKIKNYMCFDLSVPEAVQYTKKNLVIFQRVGDQDPLQKITTEGIIVDIFSEKNTNRILRELKKMKNKHFFIISPELHQLPHLSFWKRLKNLESKSANIFSLCTDFPEEADTYFNKIS